MRSFEILGVRVDDVTMAETVAWVEAMVDAPHAGCRQIATVNPEFIIAARHNPEFAGVLAACDLNVPDGANLVRGARFLGKSLRERVGGCDLTIRLAARASECGWKIFLLGAHEGVAAAAGTQLCARYPRLQIVGTYAGSPAPSETEGIVTRVNDSGAQLLFVAYGAPAQELWLAQQRGRLAARVTMGVGGSFDYISGRVPRAPKWLQRAGLEWLFRLVRQPWRIKRQQVLVEFAWSVFRARVSYKNGSG